MFTPIVAQLCDGTNPTEYFLDFKFVKAVTCTYADVAGLLVVGLLVYGGIGMSIYIRTGSIRIPAVLFLLTGGAIVGQIAAPGVAIAAIALVLLGAGAMTLLYYRYSR